MVGGAGGAGATMKRFYREVAVTETEAGHSVTLDGRPIKTPGKRPLVLPYRALADAIAAEWDAQEETVKPATMALTKLANSTIDVVADRRPDIVAETARYAATDLVCYRSQDPAELVRRQDDAWDPLMAWLEERDGICLEVTRSILPISQDDETLEAARRAVDAYSDFPLAGLHAATAAMGSVVIGLALAVGRLDARAAFDVSQLDETFQIERWGEDTEATRRRDLLRADIDAAARFLTLCE